MYSAWKVRTGADGSVYYFNSETGDMQWEKPDELKSETERTQAGECVWLPDAAHGFLAYRVQVGCDTPMRHARAVPCRAVRVPAREGEGEG